MASAIKGGAELEQFAAVVSRVSAAGSLPYIQLVVANPVTEGVGGEIFGSYDLWGAVLAVINVDDDDVEQDSAKR